MQTSPLLNVSKPKSFKENTHYFGAIKVPHLFFAVLITCVSLSLATAQYTSIPDAVFEQFLIDEGIDTDPVPDGQILTADALAVTGTFGIHDMTITDLTGLNAFKEITGVSISNLLVYSIDLSDMPNLRNVQLLGLPVSSVDFTNSTNITSFMGISLYLNTVDVSALSNLVSFSCTTCVMGSLILGNHPNLSSLVLSWNNISTLDLSQTPNLITLKCDENFIQELDLSAVPNLNTLHCYLNGIKSLDLSNLPDLRVLDCSATSLTTLDVTSNPNLIELDVEGCDLKSLYMANGANTSLTKFDARFNEELFCISVDDAVWSTVNWSAYVDNPFAFTESATCDTDGDGVADENDNCHLIGNSEQIDTDDDGSGDACDEDDDGDFVDDVDDNCPFTANSDQVDTDGDGLGNACDPDDDNDGIVDESDNCPLIANSDQTNNDGDAEGDPCDMDDDNDGVADTEDNCPLTANADQADNDADALGDACDMDDDNDGIPDMDDNCPLIANPDQSDIDIDGSGDLCDDVVNSEGVAANLTDIIEDLDLNTGQETSLLSLLGNALASCASGNTSATVNQLEALINQVEAATGKWITEEEASALIQIIDMLIQAIVDGTSDCMDGVALFTSEHVQVVNSEVTIFPNPALDRIQFGGIYENSTVEIYDASGRLMMSRQWMGSPLNISELVKGIYMVSIKSDEGYGFEVTPLVKL